MLRYSDIIENYSGLVIFTYYNKEYCINVKEVMTIIRPVDEVQLSADSIKFKGASIPFIKLNNFYGENSVLNSEDKRVLIVDLNGELIAFQVDRVNEIITFDSDIVKLLEFRGNTGNHFLVGNIIYGEKEFLVPDFISILSEVKKEKTMEFSKLV